MSKSLKLRGIDQRSSESWALVLALLAGDPAPGAAKASRNIRGILRMRRNPNLIHNGGKP